MRKQIRCHGDEIRFDIVSDFIYEYFGNSIHYIADVAGGQGMLSRILNKKYNYEVEVVDPRGYTLKGVPSRQCVYVSEMAEYYDLIVGLHPDEATRTIVESAKSCPVLVIPCCNFWDNTKKLGTQALIDSICKYMSSLRIEHELITFPFKGPKNVGILTKIK